MQTAPSRIARRPQAIGPACVLLLFWGGWGRPVEAATRRVPEAYLTIQAAINAAVEGDTVLLSPGIYRGIGNRDIELGGKDLVITSSHGAERTIIDCEDAGRGFRVHQYESPAARIEKLTIVNGNAFGGDGGGITCDIASPSISECKILNSRADLGGGLALILFGGTVDRCVIAGNWAEDGGGGVAVRFSGGVTITSCVITGNGTRGAGGGVAFADDQGDNVLRSCIVAANTAVDVGGGVYTSGSALLDRCIAWGNCSPVGAQLYASEQVTSLTCCDVDSAGVDDWNASITYDDQCVFTDPRFCAPAPCGQAIAGDWTLNESSPCLPSNSPCGQLIGALDAGCGVAFPPGACCLVGGMCMVVSEYACSTQQGLYRGNGTLCQPDPCGPTPTERTSWGRIKAAYR
jgi:hypothetical protein